MMDQNTRALSWMINDQDKGNWFRVLDVNLLGNGKMIKKMEGKIYFINFLEDSYILMVESIRLNGKKENVLVK